MNKPSSTMVPDPSQAEGPSSVPWMLGAFLLMVMLLLAT
jgi:hypothetical protein